ncbi:MAG: sugar dehydrogenase, partial [Thermoleophilia bacterium]
MRRAPLILALLAGAVVAMLPGLAPQAAQAAPTLAQIGEFSRPVYVVSPPRDIRSVFVVERGGTVRLLVDGTLRSRPFLDIRSLVSTGDGREDERGLLSIAFAPDYATSGRFYAYYVSRQPPAARAGDLVVDEFRRSATDPEIADPATRRTLIAVEHDDYQNHNG